MRAGSVIASIGITATLVAAGSVLTGLGTRRRQAKRQAVVNRLYQPNQLAHDTVQFGKKVKEYSDISAMYQKLQLTSYNAVKSVVASGDDGARLIRRVTNS
jgi:hypothetical protein